MRITKILALIVLLLVVCTPARAETTSVGLGIGYADDDIMAYSLSLTQLYQPLAAGSIAELSPTGEVAVHLWDGDRDTSAGMSLSPGLRLTLLTDKAFSPYLGVSVGGALMSERKIDSRDLGSHLLMRTKGVVGIQFGENNRHSIQGEYSHYGNLGIVSPNDGLNTYGGSYSFAF
jgi:Lipid A 3-O-deacylase (PagL).